MCPAVPGLSRLRGWLRPLPGSSPTPDKAQPHRPAQGTTIPPQLELYKCVMCMMKSISCFNLTLVQLLNCKNAFLKFFLTTILQNTFSFGIFIVNLFDVLICVCRNVSRLSAWAIAIPSLWFYICSRIRQAEDARCCLCDSVNTDIALKSNIILRACI